MGAVDNEAQSPLFFVKEEPEGGFSAKSPQFGIFTQGETWDELIENIKNAILCHFEEGEAPSSFD